MKILIIEDDERIAIPVKEDLEHQNYTVDLAFDGRKGLEIAMASHYDVVLLDLMIPSLDGFSVCRQIREQGNLTAILMLTAKSEKKDKLKGLDSGADDYLTKPFELDELSARIRALMRRSSESRNSKISCGPLMIDTASCRVTHATIDLDLTPMEYRLLLLLSRNPSRFFKTDELVDMLWSVDKTPGREAVKTHVKALRKKISAAGVSQDLIETVYGFGYRVNCNNA